MAAIQLKAVDLRASCAPDSPAKMLGPWRLVRLLGEGEWNQVFQAAPADATAASSADYAIKLVKPPFVNDEQVVNQLRREARLGRTIAHPHLVCVLSSHVDRAPYYLVMPYQSGSTLRDRLLASDGLPVAQALWIARQVAEALNALHDQGWMHGDVKPDNILLAANGHATLCDLGLAQLISSSGCGDVPWIGTPAYMPPESYDSKAKLSAGCDSYCLGVTLFEMLTGRIPFEQIHPDELAAAHRLLKPPDLSGIRADVPSRVVRLVNRLLAKEPLRRPTGLELVHALVDAEIDMFDERLSA